MGALRYRPMARLYQRTFTTAYRAHEAEVDFVAHLPRVLQHSVPEFPARFGLGIDVGAGVGPYARLMRRHCTRVVACEPNTDQAAFLRRTFGSTLDVAGVAVSDRAGVALLADDTNSGSWRRPLARLIDEDPGREATGTGWSQRCPVTTIDRLLADLQLTDVPGALVAKIDVEGHELSVLRGMTDTLAAHPAAVLIVEIEPARNPDADLVFAHLAGLGFATMVYGSGRLNPYVPPADSPPPKPGGRFTRFSGVVNNFVFVRDGRSGSGR